MGSTREREMATLFDDHGFAVMRAASSGSGTTREMPDVLASNGQRVVIIEEKYVTANTRCYVGAEEVNALQRFGEKFGADEYLAVRYSTDLDVVSTADWFVVEPSDVPRTGSGRYKLHYDIVKDERIFADYLAEWSG